MDTPAVLVADIGGTGIKLGHLVGREPAPGGASVPTIRLREPDPAAALAAVLLEYAAERALAPTAAVLGMPVSLGHDLDTVLSSPNIPELTGRRFGSELAARLGLPVRLERDMNLLLLGEARVGAARGASSALGVFFGTGVGAGLLLGGRPYRGASVGLEIGHIPIRGEGRVCVCGNVDCLEAYACGHTLVALSRESGVPVGDLFTSGAPKLERPLAEFVRDGAYAVATAVNLLDPEVAVVGGGVPEMAGFPREAFHHIVLEHLRRPLPRESLRFAWAELGSRAALHGALAVLEVRG